jgi:hypothetical protein
MRRWSAGAGAGTVTQTGVLGLMVWQQDMPRRPGHDSCDESTASGQAVAERVSVAGAASYTHLTDCETECNGLLTHDRVLKLDAAGITAMKPVNAALTSSGDSCRGYVFAYPSRAPRWTAAALPAQAGCIIKHRREVIFTSRASVRQVHCFHSQASAVLVTRALYEYTPVPGAYEAAGRCKLSNAVRRGPAVSRGS